MAFAAGRQRHGAMSLALDACISGAAFPTGGTTSCSCTDSAGGQPPSCLLNSAENLVAPVFLWPGSCFF